jgi:sugar lactone lactonase YvrE
MADRIRKVNVQNGTVHVLALSSFAASASIQGIDAALDGTVYAADFYNDVVYKVFADGRINGTLAGVLNSTGDVESSGVKTIDGNELGGKNAKFNAPYGVCVDNSGNIFVADSVNNKIKRVSASGRVKILAGSTQGDVCSDIGTSAKFYTPIGVCVDAAGIIYVADSANNKIKKIWPSGKVTSLAGDINRNSGFYNGVGMAVRFNAPKDVAVDGTGNVYVADSGNNCIRKITPAGTVSILAGGNSGAGTAGFVNGNGIQARFNNPIRLAMDPSFQFLYVLDIGNHAVRRVELGGKTATVVHVNGTTGDICVDKSGILYIAESDTE